MQAYYHSFSYFLGVILAMIYNRVQLEKNARISTDLMQISRSMRTLSFIMENTVIRYLGYLFSLGMMLGMILWMKPFFAEAKSEGAFTAAMFSALATPLFLVGYCFILMASLLKKAALFRVFHSAGFWRAFSNLLAPIGLTAPIVSLWFFLNYEKQLDFTYM
jgi:hypothetical protein